MKKILIVKYTPRHERSRTNILLDYYIEKKTKNANVEILDLEENIPEFFSSETLEIYYKRNYGWIELTQEEKELIKKFDDYTAQFKNADEVVFAYPMFNFWMPAIIKAYIDMILQKWETWDMTSEWYVGLQKDKRIVLITSSAWKYLWTDLDSFEHNIKLFRVYEWFIWSKLEVIDAGWIAYDEENVLNKAKAEIDLL